MNTKSIFYILLFYTTFLFSQENAEVLAQLPDEVSETSGLIFYNGKLITHNDSGNLPQLYEIDTTSYQIIRTVTITNIENNDWEDLAQDDQYIYIGDFGNYLGTRTDLRVYRISKQAYNQSDAITAEEINFTYEDQIDFTNTSNSDWDAEALFVLNDQLIILTKQWKSNGTVAYSLPKTPGTYEARNIDSYNVEGLVTGATFNPISNVLYLIGYTPALSSFTLRIDDVSDNKVFSDKIVRTRMNIGFAQVESITYSDENTYFFSSEFFMSENPSITLESQLYRFNTTDGEVEPEPEIEPEPEPELETEKTEIELFQRAGYELLEYNLNTDELLFAIAIYDLSGKQVLYVLGTELEEKGIDLSTLQNSVYYLSFYFDTRSVSIPFVKN